MTSDDVIQFYEEFMQDILVGAEAGEEFAEDTFFDRFTAELVDAGEVDVADRVYYGGPGGVRVDGYGGDPRGAEGQLTLFLVDYRASHDVQTLTKTDMEAAFKRGMKFIEKARRTEFRDGLDESIPAFGLADMISSTWANVSKVRLILMSNRLLSGRIDAVADGEIDGKPLSRSVWDIERVFHYVASGQGREDLIIDLEDDFGSAIPLLPAHLEDAAYESYLAVVPGKQLARIYERWGARLLEQNVRVFLQARGNVNKGIRTTLEHEPEMFFAYNNGVTATAEAIETRLDEEGLALTRLENFQIVNGGQTTASIYSALRNGKDLDRVFVQMKLSIVEGAVAEEAVPKISQYANSQNRVNAADFFSNHPYHVRMEEFSRRVIAPSVDGALRGTKWFYERARGQYQDARGKLTRSKQRNFELEYPRKQVFTKTDLAKYIGVWERRPDVVSKGAQKNFAAFAESIGKEWDRNPDQFNESYYRRTISQAIVFKSVEKLVTAQPWYDGGYRANIVAYAISKLAFDVKEMGRHVDFDEIWTDQRLPIPLEQALVLSAFRVHQELTSPDPKYRNISEWAKQQACWNRVSALDIDWPQPFIAGLVSSQERVALERDAARDQQVVNSINVQTTVVEAGPRVWNQVRSWGSNRNLLTERELDILAICVAIPSKIPTDRQCEVAMTALRRLHTEGCRLGKDLV